MKLKKTLSLVLALAMVLTLLGTAQLSLLAADISNEDEHGDICEDAHEHCEHPDAETAEPEGTSGSEDAEELIGQAVSSEEDFVITDAIEYIVPEENRPEYYQLTEEELSLPTTELIDLILEHDMLLEIGVSSFRECPAYNTMREIYNVFPELESRPDAVEAILAKYAEILSQPAQWDKLSDLSNLRALLYQSVFRERMSDSLMAVFESLRSKEKAETFDILADGYTNDDVLSVDEYAHNTATTADDDLLEDDYEYTELSNVVKTQGGVSVPVRCVVEDMSLDEQRSNASKIASKYQVETIGNATAKYNCISYAWYLPSTSNPYWIEAIATYVTDVHTVRDDENPAAGKIVVYVDSAGHPRHTAIIESVGSDGTIMCKSKWGISGLYLHKLDSVPPNYKTSSRTVKYAIFYVEDHGDYKSSSVAPDSNGHYRTCGVCNQAVRLAHDSTFTANDATTHTKKCRICNYTATESHTANALTGKCKYCKYDLSSSPVLPTRKKKLGVVVALAEPRTPAPKRPVLSC